MRASPEQKYRRAVETIVRNCGEPAREVLESDPGRFTDGKVRALAGTSPDYQHVVGRAAAAGNASHTFRPL